MRVLVGVTGASGIPYALALLGLLREKGIEVTLVASEAAERVAEVEVEGGLESLTELVPEVLPNSDLSAWPASGSNRFHAMAIIPCSVSTLSKIAHGIADNLITRAAAVALKERRTLVLVLRETPLALPVIEAMAAAARAGAVILPAMPGFYARPSTAEELVHFVAARCMSVMGLDVDGAPKWLSPPPRSPDRTPS
ncbi:MAG: UbiX family flavin prenyltransferase [Candidatus Thermoplasmatota archaeon]